MATESTLVTRSYTAGADLSSAQFCFVKLSAAGTVILCAATTDFPMGVLQNNPKSGGAAEVAVGGQSKVVASGAITFGVRVGTDASGHAVALAEGTDTTKYVAGVMPNGASGANAIAEIELNPVPHRAS